MDLPELVQQAIAELTAPVAAAHDRAQAAGADPAGPLLTALADCVALAQQVAELDVADASLATLAGLLAKAKDTVGALEDVATRAEGAQPLLLGGQELLAEITALLLSRALAVRAPIALEVASVLGLARPAGTLGLRELDLTGLPDLIGDPAAALRRRYVGSAAPAAPADAHVVSDTLLPKLVRLARALGLPAGYARFSETGVGAPDGFPLAERAMFLGLSTGGPGLYLAVRSAAEGGAGLVLAPGATGPFKTDAGGWSIDCAIGGAGPWLALTAAGVEPAPGTTPSLSLRLAATRTGAGPVFRTGGTGTRVEVGSFGVSAHLDAGAGWSGGVDLVLGGLSLVLAGGDGDGFLEKIVGDGLRVGTDVTIGWDSRRGLHVNLSSGLDVALPLGAAGPIAGGALLLSLGTDSGDVVARLAGRLAVALGPVRAELDGAGLELRLSLPASGGNLGLLDAELGFSPPTAVALGLDAGVVTGGGSLQCDPAKGLYAGTLRLTLEAIGLDAVGLLATKRADGGPLTDGDGHRTYSLLAIISGRFPPIQVGFGFSLVGLGGLLALNRTANVDALRTGVRAGALGAVLSPSAPAGDAGRLIDELSGLFPVAVGRFLVGPTARLEWGGPAPLLAADLGLFLELPAPIRVVVLGRLQVGLPQLGSAAVVRLNLDALGVIELDKGEVSIDASLYDSSVAGFAVSGDMAARFGWGENPQFALSIGGFHPAYRPPPGLPALRRLTISLSSGDNPTLRLSAYLALTSNTIQLGARADLAAHAGPCSIAGTLGFDALLQTDPFGLILDFCAAVVFRFDGADLLGVSVSGRLSGPGPWHVQGEASITLLFVTVSVGFDASFGDPAPPLPATPVRVLDLVAAQLRDLKNWRALPPAADQVATLLPAPAGDAELRVHPLGGLAVRQRTVPLGRHLDRFGSAPIAGPATVAITGVTTNGQSATIEPVEDLFAPAQFFQLTDAQKLSTPNFASAPAGVTVDPGGTDLDELAAADAASLEYTVTLIDDLGVPPAALIAPMTAATAGRLAATSPAAAAATVVTGPRRYAADRLGIGLRPARPWTEVSP